MASLIKWNSRSALADYYASTESGLSYRMLLGGRRHFGYYSRRTRNPFPLSTALLTMEEHLITNLRLKSDSVILDAGCGSGHVSIHLAQKGYSVQAIDITKNHVVEAQRNIKSQQLEHKITATVGDYHNLETFHSKTFDGIFTMETFVHAADPEQALQEFFRVLRPGGRICLYEKEAKDNLDVINTYAAMPAFTRFSPGALQAMLGEAGFENIIVEDLTQNILPMLRFFYILARVPYILISALDLESRFVNTVAAYQGYRNLEMFRYVAVSARKPVV